MNKYVKIVANRLHKLIQEQQDWIEKQEFIVDEFIATGVNPEVNQKWDLRQCIQALNTGKMTQQTLLDKFDQEIGMPYSQYVEEYQKQDKPVESEIEKLAKKLVEFMAAATN